MVAALPEGWEIVESWNDVGTNEQDESYIWNPVIKEWQVNELGLELLTEYAWSMGYRPARKIKGIWLKKFPGFEGHFWWRNDDEPWKIMEVKEGLGMLVAFHGDKDLGDPWDLGGEWYYMPINKPSDY
jgi:hypothetical protein